MGDSLLFFQEGRPSEAVSNLRGGWRGCVEYLFHAGCKRVLGSDGQNDFHYGRWEWLLVVVVATRCCWRSPFRSKSLTLLGHRPLIWYLNIKFISQLKKYLLTRPNILITYNSLCWSVCQSRSAKSRQTCIELALIPLPRDSFLFHHAI